MVVVRFPDGMTTSVASVSVAPSAEMRIRRVFSSSPLLKIALSKLLESICFQAIVFFDRSIE